jgi:hypothetical protein
MFEPVSIGSSGKDTNPYTIEATYFMYVKNDIMLIFSTLLFIFNIDAFL